MWKYKLDYKYHQSKGNYIIQVIISSFAELSKHFKDLNKNLVEAIKTNEDVIADRVSASSLKESEEKLTQSVEAFFEEVAKIKNKM